MPTLTLTLDCRPLKVGSVYLRCSRDQPSQTAQPSTPATMTKMMADFAELLMEVCRALCCMTPSVMPGVNGSTGDP